MERLREMKIKATCMTLLGITMALSAYAQNITAYRQPANVGAIPRIVTETFRQQYPKAAVSGWYVTHLVYWQNDYSSDWYYGWYGQRTIVVYTYEKPNYYEVEFVENVGEHSRAIYNLYGYWYETRTQIKGLPMVLYDSLRKTKHADWKISLIMEKIESPMWPVDIYRFQVAKGLKSQIIRMDPDGNIIQLKELSD